MGQTAAKYDFALGKDSPGQDALQSRLVNGEDPQIRDDTMQLKELELRRTKIQMLNNLVQNSPNGVSDDDANFVMQMNKTDLAQIANPKTVMETEFARRFVSTIATRDPDQHFQQAESAAPEATHQQLDVAEFGVARNHIVQSKLADVQDQIKNQSWGGYLGDLAANDIVGSIADVRLMNLAKSPSVTSLIPGKNLEEQVEYLHTLDPIKFDQTVDQALNSIGSNLQLKQKFLQALVSYSDSDRILTGLGNIADIATLGQAGLGIKSLMKSAVTASKDATLDAAKIAGTTGDFKGAAILSAEPGAKAAGEDTLRNQALSINGGGERWFTGDPANLSRESTQRFLDTINKNQSLAQQFLSGTDRVDRTSQAQRLAVRQQSYDDLMKELGKKATQSNVLDLEANGNLSMTTKATGVEPPAITVTDQGPKPPGYPDALFEGLNAKNEKVYGLESGRKVVAQKDGTWLEKANEPVSTPAYSPVGEGQPKVTYSTVSNRTGTKFQTGYNPMTNTEVMTVTFGKDNGEMFPNQATAQKWADTKLGRFDNSSKSVEPVAGKWVVRLRQDLPDSLESQKELTIPLTDQYSQSPLNSLIGRFREQSAVLGNANFQARLQVTHGSQRLYDLFQDMLQPLSSLGKEERTKLSAILNTNRDYIDPMTGERGKFFGSRGEFEHAYSSKYGTLPTEKQTTAYYAYVQASDLDGMVRNASVARDKIRAGVKKVSDKLTIDDPNRAANDPQSKHDLVFEGRRADSVPFGDGNNTTIAVRDPKSGKVKFIWKERASDKQKAMVEDVIKKGGSVYQGYNGHIEIPGGEGRAVSHYISGSSQEGRVDLNGFWRPGGHVIYEDSHYIKQPIARGEFYAGDRAVATAPNAKVAAQRAQAYEQARQMMLRNDPGLDQYVSKNIGLGVDGKAFRELFERSTKDGRIIPGLDPNQPFMWTKQGERIADKVQLDTLRMKENPYNIANYDRAFTGERDARTIPALIDEAGVRHVHEDGHLLDPFQAMQYAARSMVDTTLRRDYLVKSAKQFAQQFADILDVARDRPANRAAYINDHFEQLFYNPPYLKGADPDLVRSAENVRKTILRQWATSDPETSRFESMKQSIAQYVYGAVGDKTYRKVAANWMIPILKDPILAARTMAFNLHLGFFNIPEMIMQAASWPSIIAISPKAGLKATALYAPVQAARMNINMLEHSAQTAAMFGWKPDDFKAMFNSLMNSGWLAVHGSTAVMDDIANPRLFQSTMGPVLHWGQTPFNAGIRFHRVIGYATAWDEWTTAHAGQAMTREGQNWVLQRANTLTQNMSAAGNAVWQRGILAVPAQFFTYQLRLMEQYFGQQLTTPEKLRLFAGQALTFGLPTAVGGAVGVWPIAQSLKEYLVENNIPHEDGAVGAVVHGIPQFLLKLATGSSFEVGERFGQGGLDVGRAWWRGDKSAWQLLGGAAGQTVSDLYNSTMPFLAAASEAMNLSPHSGLYKLDLPTIERVLDNATGASGAIKLAYALETQKWMTRYGTYVDKATPFQAVFNYLTGANLSEINDAYAKQEVLQDHSAVAKVAMQNVVDMYKRAFAETDDPKQREEYFKMAKAWALPLTPQEFEHAARMAVMQSDQSKVDAMSRALQLDKAKRSPFSDEILNNVPAGQQGETEQ